MKIYSWNVNGIRSVFDKGFLDWIKKEDPDIVCLQEIKADSEELDSKYKNIDGYYSYFNSAEKKGYSGTAVYTKIKPKSVENTLGIERFDSEGRVLKLEFPEFTLFNFYIPNGSRDKRDTPYKLKTYEKLIKLFDSIKEKNVLLVGDFNIAHEEIDVFHAKNNQNNTMFTPEERKQLDEIVKLGYVDTFRKIYPENKSYSWWPYMLDLRERDIGWRIDYCFASPSLFKKVKDAFTRKEVLGSDHCPVGVEIESKMKLAGPTYPKENLFS